MLHYKVELGPVNFQNMGDIQMNKEVNKLDDIDTIDGNGQLYLALQDISMQNFTDELNKVKSLLFLKSCGPQLLAHQTVIVVSWLPKLLFQAAGLSAKEDSKRFLVVVTDDEWDMTDLKLCSEITTKGPLDAEAKKREIVKFAKDRFQGAF